MKTAILIDGAFYRKQADELFGEKTASERAWELFIYCMKHLEKGKESRELYRIFYYDCPPLKKNIYHPLLKKDINFEQSELCSWMNRFLQELTTKRKLALRLGRLSEQASYTLRPSVVKDLMDKKISLEDLEEKHFMLDVKQKGVDMRIGLDISSMAFKKQVDQIILIAGDSDFVPAAKQARREGIDFILDPMNNHINPDLNEHVDGIESHYKEIQQEDKERKSKKALHK